MIQQQDIIVIAPSEDDIGWALETTYQKILNSGDNQLYDSMERSFITSLDNLFQGDLAKNIIISWLKGNGLSEENIQEYDKTRTDNFQDSDPGWDFETIKKVEVKSSILSNQGFRNDNSLINVGDVKVIAGHRKNNKDTLTDPQDLRPDVFIQIYFFDAPLTSSLTKEEVINRLRTNGRGVIKELLNLDNRLKEARIFAWATKEDVSNFKRINEKRRKPTYWGHGSLLYWYCKIKDSRPISELPEFLNN